MRTIIHVNQHTIKSNRKHGKSDPPLSLITYKGTKHANEIKITGEITFVYRPDKPLSCGAHVWAHTTGEVEILS